MENCLDSIVVLNDVSEAEHHPVERSTRYRKLHSHISKQREALFRYKQNDRLFLHQRLPRALCPWNRHPTKPFLSMEIFDLCLIPPFCIGISTIYYLHLVILRVIDTIDVKDLLNLKENFHDVFFSKTCSKSVCKFFPFDLLIIRKQ